MSPGHHTLTKAKVLQLTTIAQIRCKTMLHADFLHCSCEISIMSTLLQSFYLFIYFVFCLFRATPIAYGASQARGLIRATAASLCQSYSQLHLQLTPQLTAMPDLKPTEARPGVEPATSWFLAGFVSTAPRRELLLQSFYEDYN